MNSDETQPIASHEDGPVTTMELVIERLGAQGDGIATRMLEPGGHAEALPETVYVPYTLPGERVCVQVDGARAQLQSIITPSPERIAPVCPHFTDCGGCSLQHIAPDAYGEWKRALVVEAFRQRAIEADVAPLTMAGAGARRRAMLSALATKAGIVLGYHAARDDHVIDLSACPVLDQRIVESLSDVRRLLGALPRWEGEARVAILAAENGLDVAIDGAVGKSGLDPNASAKLGTEASRVNGLLRLVVDGIPIFQMAKPALAMGGASVVPAPGSFLQASAAAEKAMADVVLKVLPKKAKRAIDLFSGVGAFCFPLASRVAVAAVDSDEHALSALDAAMRTAHGLKPITTLHRDLFREPLSRKELEPFDLAVFDPPRAGAKAQAEMLAKSKVPVVVAVSCNPATLARDARILIDGGYRLGKVTPIDQFHWSAHVEAVAVFRRPK